MSNPVDSFPAFAERVRLRLEAGRAFDATNPAVERPTLDLIRKIQEERRGRLRMVVALWTRLVALRAGREATP